MPDPSSSTPRGAIVPARPALVLLGAYLVQGLVAAIGLLMLVKFAQLGVSLETQVGLWASAMVPWVIKIAVALGLDLAPSASYRVRAAVLTVLQLSAVVWIWILADAWRGGEGGLPGSLQTVAAAWVLLNFAIATQDVFADSLALDTLGGRRWIAAAAMVTGHTLGAALIGPLVIGARIDDAGMSAGLSMPLGWLAGLALLPLAVLWLPGRPIRAREQAPARRPRSGADLARLIWLPLAFAACMFAPSLTSAAVGEFLFVELAWDYRSFTSIVLPIGAISGIVGALAWGPLVARVGPAPATMIAGAALGASWLGFASLSSMWSDPTLIEVLAGAEGLLQSALYVGLYALALLASARSPMPVTTFALAMVALNLPRVLAPLAAPMMVERGWITLFAACGASQLLAAALLWPFVGWRPSDSVPPSTAR